MTQTRIESSCGCWVDRTKKLMGKCQDHADNPISDGYEKGAV